MFESIENISLGFSISSLLIVVLIIISIFFSIFVYRNSIVKINKYLKVILIFLRSAALTLLILLLFNLILDFVFIEKKSPRNFIFIDNSESIVNVDSQQVTTAINYLVNNLLNDSFKLAINTFGADCIPLESVQLNDLKYNSGSTNFENIFNFISNVDENIASAVIISDGIINSGVNPQLSVSELNFPVITVGVGDTSNYSDISVADVLTNEIIYRNETTPVNISLFNSSDEQIISLLEFYENNKLISSQPANLIPGSITKKSFNYTPVSTGTKTIDIRLKPFPNEKNISNNSKRFTIDVLKDKIKVALINGEPSVDGSFVKNSLANEKRFELSSITYANENPATGENDLQKIEDADVIVMLSFPASKTPGSLIEKIYNKVRNEQTPCFVQITNKTDPAKLLPIVDVQFSSIRNSGDNQLLVQPASTGYNKYNEFFGDLNIWSDLPPISSPNLKFTLKQNVTPLLTFEREESGNTSIPVMLLSKTDRRLITFLGYNLWKWKLQYKNETFLNSVMSNIINWLSTRDDLKQFRIQTNKKIYHADEEVEFTSHIYNELFEPITNADISVKITNGQKLEERNFDNEGDGNYKLLINSLPAGDYTYSAVVQVDGGKIFELSDKFIIDKVSLEDYTHKADFSFLRNLAYTANGEFYYINEANELKNFLNQNPLNKTTLLHKKGSYDPKNHQIFLVIIILLFSLEWLIRKRVGLN